MKSRFLAGIVVLSALSSGLVRAGDLTPPVGPVMPTMKTLDQIEPRKAVNETNTPGNFTSKFVISQPGSYYLTGNITGDSGKSGILITANYVSLDLNGFALLGVPGTVDGITMTSFRVGIMIRNVAVQNWGDDGISTAIDSGRIEDITATANGGWGINNQSSGTFSTHLIDCEMLNNGLQVTGRGGISVGSTAVITNCIARGNTGSGFVAIGNGFSFDHCVSSDNTDAGFSLGNNSSLTHCIATSNGVAGFRVGSRAHMVGCLASSSNLGFVLQDHCTLTGCSASSFNTAFQATDNGRFVDCSAISNNSAGFIVQDGNVFSGCRANSCAGDGFNGRFGNRFESCFARSNVGDGIESNSGAHILNCTLDGNGSGVSIGANIRLTGGVSRVEGNSLVGADFGIQTTGGGNTIVRNSSAGSSSSYGGIAPGNDVGPIGSAATAASPWANIQY